MTNRKDESNAIAPASAELQRTMDKRKHSTLLNAEPKHLTLDVTEEGNDYAPAFRKKMSLP